MDIFLGNHELYKKYLEERDELNRLAKISKNRFNKWTGEKRARMFDKVLSFPKGTDHLKYFENNPHPDKISDKDLIFYELFNQNSINGDFDVLKLEFELLKQALNPHLSDFERKLLSLPDVLQQEIKPNAESGYNTMLTHLRDSFLRYFPTPLDKNILPGIQWIAYPFILDYYPAQKAIADLRVNLFNTEAMKNLGEKLREAGAFGNERKDFYLWNTSPYNWDAMSYQARAVEWFSFPFAGTLIKRLFFRIIDLFKPEKLIMPSDLPPEQYGALGNFTINALPEGYVQPKGNGKYDICVEKMYFFINDSFNFEGSEDLSLWRLNESSNEGQNNTTKSLLTNSDFRDFRRHGYGREFPVLSRLHEVEDFKPICKPYIIPGKYEKPREYEWSN